MLVTDHRTFKGPATVRILVVEDDAVCRATLARALRRPDRTVVSVGTALEALKLVETEPFDLVVLDFALGNGMNGDDVLRRLQARPETKGIPVIVLSGEASSKELLRCFDLGATECFTKPMSMVVLRHKAEELIARRSVVPSIAAERDKGHLALLEVAGQGPEDLSAWLRAAGYSVSLARSASELLRRIDERSPDCVVLALAPGADEALVACDLLKKQPRTQALPVVVLTPHGATRSSAYEHQAICIVEIGPDAQRELAAAVGAVLVQQRRTRGIIDVGDIRLHKPESAVYHRGALVATLDHSPFAILMRLVMSSSAPVSDEDLRRAAAVRPSYHRRAGSDGPPRTMPTYIYNLRQQLGKELGNRIRRVNGSGYAYVDARAS